MPQEKAEALHDLKTYRGFLEQVEEAGYDFAVIGGCAVAVYAAQLEEAVFSADLDLIVTPATLPSMLEWARRRSSIRIEELPQPRNIPVALLYWDDLEVNILTWSTGLPEANKVTELAREVEIDGLVVPIADPFDLLANKLAVKRDKDLPHIEILERFVEAEIKATFESETSHRHRLAPARRYLETFQLDRLPEELASELIGRAKYPSDWRFLASSVPDSLRQTVLEKTTGDDDLRAEVSEILERR